MDETAKIRKRAHELYEQKGKRQGFELEDWLEAEAEIGKVRHHICDAVFWLGVIAGLILVINLMNWIHPLWVLCGFFFALVFWFTFYTHFRRRTLSWFSPARESFNTAFKFIPAFGFAVAALTFILNYEPFFSVGGVVNQADYQEIANGNEIKLPETSRFSIKNESKVWVGKSQVRYWFISSPEGAEKGTCSLDLSTSEENFSFGPEQTREFLFSFGNAAHQSNQAFDHLFLVIYFEYTPPLKSFTRARGTLWEVYHYDPIKQLWVVMRKNHPPRQADFERWKQNLATNSIKLPKCLPPPKQPETNPLHG